VWEGEGKKGEPDSVSSTASTMKPSQENGPAKWMVSEKVTLKKSTFVARVIEITSAGDAKTKLTQLMASNPDLRSASHNITAFQAKNPGFLAGLVVESGDDGETGGGRHILKIMQDMNLFGVLLLCTRWYGGIMLGPDRWKLMSQVCRDALSQRLRIAGVVTGGEALWGLDTSDDAIRKGHGGLPIHAPEGARAYLLKSFASAAPEERESPSKKKKIGVVLEREKERNLGLLLGALELLFESWVEHISTDELDRRAWGWYLAVRPQVADGVAGWGAKNTVSLKSILDLRRKG